MNGTKLASTTAIATAVAFGAVALTTTAHAGDWTKIKGIKVEKVYGVAKAGKNDCAAKGHSCAGMSKVDNDPNEWIFLPKGVSDKIGGSLKPADAAPAAAM
jgi:uncharacterized membrane protein